VTRLKLKDLADRYGFVDPAAGKKLAIKSTRARSAIVIVAPDPKLPRLFVLHAWAERCPTDRLIETIFEVCERFKPRVMGMEANAMQSAFADSVSFAARLQQKRYPIVPIHQSTKVDKDFRIRSILQPLIGYGRLFTQASQTELNNELAAFPMSPTKDLVDALASACALVPPRATRAQVDEESEARLQYLRDSGAPPDYIERMAAEMEVQS
jgi:Holliday junction resolvasome RuvABC endonuclease subunit